VWDWSKEAPMQKTDYSVSIEDRLVTDAQNGHRAIASTHTSVTDGHRHGHRAIASQWRSQDLEVGGHRGSGKRKSPSGVQGQSPWWVVWV